MTEELIKKLNAPTPDERLDALRQIKKLCDEGKIPTPKATQYVNNHIHTTFSFSPYSPTKALYLAWMNGLKTAGIMDHDSMGGAQEFIEAGKILQMPVTVGIECRVSFASTSLNGRRINNPDQTTVAYVTMHGVPHQNIDKVNSFFAPYRALRNERNKKMCANINAITEKYGITLDFEKDVIPLSQFANTGSITERHIMFALAKKITSIYPTPEKVVDFLKNKMELSLSPKAEKNLLCGLEYPDYYEYDILGILKSSLVEKIYIPATDECPSVTEYIKLAKECGAISAYAYLGDVGDSVTGDKKTQKFEDDYIYELFDVIKQCGFDAVTYMPTRNTKAQLERVMKLCQEHDFFQISGEDINSPRQSFICAALDDPDFSHLVKATYALIGHEKEATVDLTNAMFSKKTKEQYPSLAHRIEYFASKI